MVERNKRKIYYAKNLGEVEVLDNGRHTGEFKQSYSDPIECYANIRQVNGDAIMEKFGIHPDYHYKIITDKDFMDEDSVLWINCSPEGKFNAKVTQKSIYLGSITYYVKIC